MRRRVWRDFRFLLCLAQCQRSLRLKQRPSFNLYAHNQPVLCRFGFISFRFRAVVVDLRRDERRDRYVLLCRDFDDCQQRALVCRLLAGQWYGLFVRYNRRVQVLRRVLPKRMGQVPSVWQVEYAGLLVPKPVELQFRPHKRLRLVRLLLLRHDI